MRGAINIFKSPFARKGLSDAAAATAAAAAATGTTPRGLFGLFLVLLNYPFSHGLTKLRYTISVDTVLYPFRLVRLYGLDV